ncbi:MAG TPA: PAS domain S-box protein [Candidatus Angelobacter sp.]|nr:PAS domain S-box protein [Candidatus Angelobacter sp.]
MGLQPDGTARAKEQYVIPLALPEIGALLESFADPVLLIDAEIYRVLGWNRRVLEQYGFRPDEPLRRPLLDLFARESRLELKSWLRASAPGSLDVHSIPRNGSKQRFSLTAHRMNHYQGAVFLLCLAATPDQRNSDHDTAKVGGLETAEVAAALHESEAKFQALAETTPAAVFIHRGQRVVFANRAAEKMTGYRRGEMYSGEFWVELTPASRTTKKPFTTCEGHKDKTITTEPTELHGGEPERLEDLRGSGKVSEQATQNDNLRSEELLTSRYQVKFVSKCGEERWLDVMTAPMSYEGSAAVLAVAMDITSHKEVEENLVIQKAYLERLIESAPEAIVIVSDQNVILRANSEFERLFGYGRDEVLGKLLDPLIVPPHKMQESQVLTEFSLRGESASLETVRQTRDGSLVDVSFLVTPINIGNGQIACYCIYRDITERKRDQEALQHSEEHFRSLVESSSDGIVILSPEGAIRYQNPSVERLMGYSGDDVIGTNAFTLIHPEDLQAARTAFEYTLKNSRLDQPVELRLHTKDGNWRSFEVAGSTLKGTGNSSGLVVSCRDLSERRKTERALLESEAKFRAVAEMAMTVIYILNESGKWIYLNPASEKVLEYSREELLGRSPAIIIHPDHREAAATRAKARFRGWENSSRYELKIITKSGKLRWLDYCANVINFGGERAILGTAHDITELKRNELLQRALYRISEQASSAEHLDTLYQSIHEIIGELMEARNFYIALWDPASQRITFPYFRDERNVPPPEPMPRGKGLTGYVLRSGQPLLATHEVVQRLVEAGELERCREDSRIWLGVPLRFGGSVIGVLALQSYDGHITYGEQEKYILTFVSQHVASALRRKRHEDALRESESRYRSLVHSAVHGMYYSSIEDRFEYVNQALVNMLGYDSEEEVLRLKLSTDLYADPEERRHLVEKYRNCTEVRWEEVAWKRKDGKIIQVRAAGRAKLNEKGETTGFEMIAEDLAERRMLEEQLRQSQKMEAVGRLAGGIAHDFNNLLTVIKGYSDLMLSELKVGKDPLRLEAEEVKKAADRAGALVQQLLAFSRRQVLAPKVIDLNALVANMDTLLRPLLREDIDLRTALQPKLGKIKADPGQMEQVIMNLAVNARDAMPRGGKLTIETVNVDLDPAYVREHSEMSLGQYVMLAVSDSGVGMDENTRLRVFEPFFTTKETGKGTGLGLSTVYGIVKQSGGYIWVYSEPGRGTTFKIYLPRVDAQPEALGRQESAFASYRGIETVLLLEDEDGVRALMRHMLRKQGYTVLEAKHGQEAIYLCEHHKGPIQLLVTDVILEQMSGREVAEQLSLMRPEMKTLYISGYTDDAIVHHGVLSHEMPFLQKPFTAEGLIKKVRQVIGID